MLQGVQVAATEEWDEYAERVLAAAEQQYSEFGLRRTSMDRIAEAAGVSRITLYRRFANREALISAVVVRAFRQFIAEFDAEVSTIADPEARFVRGVVVAADQLSRDALLRRLVLTDPIEVLPLLTTEGAPLLMLSRAYVMGQLERARDDGMPIAGDLELLAELLVRLAHSLLLSAGSAFSGDEARLADFARRSILPLLYGTADT